MCDICEWEAFHPGETWPPQFRAQIDEFRGEMMVEHGVVPCMDCGKFISHMEIHACRPLWLCREPVKMTMPPVEPAWLNRMVFRAW